MKSSRGFLLFILIIPWLTVPLLGKTNFKKYLPAAIFICTFTKVIDLYGEKKKWWRFYKGIFNLNSMDFFNLGPYIITSLWMLKLTYGKWPLYFISNGLLHILFIYRGLEYANRFKILSLVKLKKIHYLLIDFLRASLLYGFQYLIDLSRVKKLQTNKN